MRILIADEDSTVHDTIAELVQNAGYEAQSAFHSAQTLSLLNETAFDAVLLDPRLDLTGGVRLFERIRQNGHQMPVVYLTDCASRQNDIGVIPKEAFGSISKPITPDSLAEVLERIDTRAIRPQPAAEPKRNGATRETAAPEIFVSESPVMQQIFKVAKRAAPTEATILLLGPSGTGKTVLAKRIHAQSRRSTAPFVVVHCPSLSKELLESELFGHVKGSFTGAIRDTWGKIDAANGGTIFLDEIGDLPFEIQAKLLRFLQERHYERIGESKTRSSDVRIIAATNKNLQQEVQRGTFRDDLFYRLNVISIELPPLSARRSDLPHLAQSFLEYHDRKNGYRGAMFTVKAMQAMADYDWPGNLRELNNAVERCLVLSSGRMITIEDLPSEIRRGSMPRAAADRLLQIGGPHSLAEIEEAHILGVLANAENYQQAAEILGINKTTLYRKRKRVPALEIAAEPEATYTIC